MWWMDCPRHCKKLSMKRWERGVGDGIDLALLFFGKIIRL